MGHQTFNDSQTQLDINGPLLSFTQDPATSTSMLTVSPATTDGDTTIDLENSNSAFDSDTTYTFTALNTFTAGVRLYGAAGGKNGGKGGSVSGNVKFESGVSYVLEVGKIGSQNGTVGVGSGGTGGANGGSGGGYTGLFRASVSQANALLIAGGGGGDGGGGGPLPVLSFALQPQNATVNAGETATFTITKLVSPEDGPVAYQWYRSTDGGFAFAAITGATTNTYAVTALSYMTGYRFRCRISGPIGAPAAAENSPLDSNAVTLTVTGGGSGGSTDNRFDSTSSTMDSTLQTYDGT